MSDWPGSNDYTIAIQSPSTCFRDSDLRHAAVEFSKRTRMPRVVTGNFAQVYELRNSPSRWAVKCFTRSAADIRGRYSQLAQAIAATQLPYFVDFKFIDNEILVNGKRYPIVKMQWVEGQSLDKFVEANLYRPHALLEAAARLAQLVKDLEQHQLAHGDLQHGNIVFTSAGVKLVDYDGMFAPAFSGRPAPEVGLPSYQHPRRSPRDYAVGLDRFSLLVLCTGLCALASDPALWYEFNTGENLLFTADDFRNPTASKLLRRLRSVSDAQVKGFADALSAACSQPPLAIPFPQHSISTTSVSPRTPWWVNAPPSESRRGAENTEKAQAVATWMEHWRAAAVFTIGILSLALWLQISPAISIGTTLVAFAALLIERVAAYGRLPVIQRQRELRGRISQKQTELGVTEKLKKVTEQRLTTLLQQETTEKGQELKRIQEAHTAAYLTGIDISRLMEIKGIGPYVVGNFRAANVNNALQLKQRGPYAQGVGAQRRHLIQARLADWERGAARGLPQGLSPDAERRIEAKYAGQRQGLTQEISAVAQRLGAIGAEVRQAEWNLKQVHVPTFMQFVKHSF